MTMAKRRKTIKRVKVIRENRSDPNPWLVSDLPFSVLHEWTDQYGELFYTICPYGSSAQQQEDKAHSIPASHTAPHEWKTL